MKVVSSRLALVCGFMLLFSTGNATWAAVANDSCANAMAIGNVTNLAFDTTNATFDGPGHFVTGKNIWFCYTASCSGTATISLVGSSYDTKMAIYKGCECPASANSLIKAVDDARGRQAEGCIPVTAGNQYLIEVGGFGTASGEGLLTITCNKNGLRPANDDCVNATHVGNISHVPFDTTCATIDGPGYCSRLSHNIWYHYTATSTGNVTVSLLGSEYDTSLSVSHARGCPPLLEDEIECNDDFADTPQSQITFAANYGQSYLIEVGGYDVDYSGAGVISIYEGGEAPGSDNDNCIDAQKIGEVTNLAFDTRDATFDGPGLCMQGRNRWYRYTASCTGQATISLCGSNFDTVLAVYRGWECYPSSNVLLGCNDDACGRQSQLKVNVVAGNQYLIEVGGYDGSAGRGVLTISCEGGGPTPSAKRDLGDAPDSTNNFGNVMTAYTHQGLLPVLVNGKYPTVFDDGSSGPVGPAHERPGAVAYLGEMVTLEDEADLGSDQDGVNNLNPQTDTANKDKGDDGVIFPISMPQCRWSTFDYTVRVVQPGTDLWVNVWCDWNRDGDWDDALECTAGAAKEWAVQNQFLYGLSAGTHRITTPAIVAWHPANGPDQMWMRITLSEKPWKGGSNPGQPGNGGSGPRSKYDIGETEDYYFAPDKIRSVCEDFNGNGVINTQDLVDLTAAWLSSCPE